MTQRGVLLRVLRASRTGICFWLVGLGRLWRGGVRWGQGGQASVTEANLAPLVHCGGGMYHLAQPCSGVFPGRATSRAGPPTRQCKWETR
ncbi:hypothetical protein E2C01_102652 [Portunus trituberculatus]|uniref:Uncharacterized protein n=1 Tax=Portunus trituberculatus TaxID=210409 RepID=A0A5B7KDU8_PORTR|nr:hypothetical protein [Portunus trituberculatus]